MSIKFPPDMYVGQQGHPQCGFFEAFASSADPYCDFYGEFFCHMVSEKTPALVCKGDYLLCPLAYGKSRLTKYAPDVASASSAEPDSGLESVPAVESDSQPRG